MQLNFPPKKQRVNVFATCFFLGGGTILTFLKKMTIKRHKIVCVCAWESHVKAQKKDTVSAI